MKSIFDEAKSLSEKDRKFLAKTIAKNGRSSSDNRLNIHVCKKHGFYEKSYLNDFKNNRLIEVGCFECEKLN